MGGVVVRKHVYDAFMKGRSTSSSCSTATPIPAIPWPARPRSPRSTSTATRTCSSALIISESQIDEMFSDRLPKMLAAANG
jgi:hypothetical protein